MNRGSVSGALLVSSWLGDDLDPTFFESLAEVIRWSAGS